MDAVGQGGYNGCMVSVFRGNPLLAAAWLLADRAVVNTLIWGVALVGGVVALGVVLLLLRRKYHPRYAVYEHDAGFSMDRLERLCREGEISDEEFRRLRHVALGLDIPAAEKDNAPSSAPTEDVDAKGASAGDPDSQDGREKDDE